MNLLRVTFSFLSVAGLGVLFGLGLAVASRILAVKKDVLQAKLEEALPGLNCGTCGYAGCSAYAEAIAGEEDVSLTLCLPGAEKTALEISEILGVEVSFDAEKKVAQVHCRGSRDRAQVGYLYNGVKDCNALHAMFGGDKICPFGCLGLGSCIRVCPVDAISTTEEGLVWVDKEACIACGNCIDICPTGVMQWIPYEADYLVACSSTDKGPVTKKYCSVGCIGCKICEKKSPDAGYKVDNFLSRIDHSVQGDRIAGAEACPTKCIVANNDET